jgi:hypothetical protein
VDPFTRYIQGPLTQGFGAGTAVTVGGPTQCGGIQTCVPTCGGATQCGCAHLTAPFSAVGCTVQAETVAPLTQCRCTIRNTVTPETCAATCAATCGGPLTCVGQTHCDVHTCAPATCVTCVATCGGPLTCAGATRCDVHTCAPDTCGGPTCAATCGATCAPAFATNCAIGTCAVTCGPACPVTGGGVICRNQAFPAVAGPGTAFSFCPAACGNTAGVLQECRVRAPQVVPHTVAEPTVCPVATCVRFTCAGATCIGVTCEATCVATCGGPTACGGATCVTCVVTQCPRRGHPTCGVSCIDFGPTECCPPPFTAYTHCRQATCGCGSLTAGDPSQCPGFTCAPECQAQLRPPGITQGPVTQCAGVNTCGGETSCIGATCGGPTVCGGGFGCQPGAAPGRAWFPTDGCPVHTGVQACPRAVDIVVQTAGATCGLVTCATCGPPATCVDQPTYCGRTCVTATCAAEVYTCAFPGCGPIGGVVAGATILPTRGPQCWVSEHYTACCLHTFVGCPVPTHGGESVCLVCVRTLQCAIGAEARGEAPTRVTFVPTQCGGIVTCTPECPREVGGFTHGPLTHCGGVHTCGPATSCPGVTCGGATACGPQACGR